MIAQWPLILTPSSWGKSLPPPAALVYCESDRSKPTLVERARRRWGIGTSGVAGKELGDEPAEGGVEGRAAAGGVGEQRAAAGLDVPPQGVEVFPGEGERGAAVQVDQGVIDQARVAGARAPCG